MCTQCYMYLLSNYTSCLLRCLPDDPADHPQQHNLGQAGEEQNADELQGGADQPVAGQLPPGGGILFDDPGHHVRCVHFARKARVSAVSTTDFDIERAPWPTSPSVLSRMGLSPLVACWAAAHILRPCIGSVRVSFSKTANMVAG